MNNMLRKLRASCLALCFVLTLTLNASARQDGDIQAAEQYLAGHELQLKETTRPIQRITLLRNLAPAALAAGKVEKARTYAQELVSLGEAQSKYVDASGQAVHIGNLVLGRIALAAGKVGKAKEYLLAAGRAAASSTLKSFGPNMLLAKELIEKGERDAVVEYLDLCAKFWERDEGRLEQWKNIVRQGGVPNFGFNLTAGLSSWRYAK
ncbi:MAG TPA: hypothetical protein VF791_07390 [Pyrinomonadaceae bacterium]